jgi:hypothetical protein
MTWQEWLVNTVATGIVLVTIILATLIAMDEIEFWSKALPTETEIGIAIVCLQDDAGYTECHEVHERNVSNEH